MRDGNVVPLREDTRGGRFEVIEPHLIALAASFEGAARKIVERAETTPAGLVAAPYWVVRDTQTGGLYGMTLEAARSTLAPVPASQRVD